MLGAVVHCHFFVHSVGGTLVVYLECFCECLAPAFGEHASSLLLDMCIPRRGIAEA